MPAETRKKLDELVTEMVALDFEPYSMVDGLGFKALMDFVVPEYDLPDRTNLSRVLMPELYEELRSTITEILQSDMEEGIKCICYTSDGWTSRHGDSYLSLTVHYLSKTFENRDFTLGMRYLGASRHTATVLQSALEKMIDEWPLAELGNVPIYIVTDNAANITNAVHLVGWDGIRCFAHTLNLALNDGKKETDGLDELLKKVIVLPHLFSATFR